MSKHTNMPSAAKSIIKKKRVAPLVKPKATKNSENTSTGNDFVFTDDMLNDIFKDVAHESEINSSKNIANPIVAKTEEEDPAGKDKILDLDDWIPESLNSNKALPKISTSQLNEFKALTKTMSNSPSSLIANEKHIRDRKEMLFSSIEFEEDSTLKLRFVKRLVPVSKLKELDSSLKQVPLYDATRLPEQDKDWYTFGVISDYRQLKKEKSGRMEVTNLAADPYSVSFLLFGSAFINPKQISVGSIVCISKPKKGNPFNGKHTFIVNNADQILIAGMSRDFALCGSAKKSGGACRVVVNQKICRYCKFHAAALYKDQNMAKEMKAAAVGSGIKTSSVGLWNSPQNQTRFLTTEKKNVAQIKKDNNILSKLNSSSSPAVGPKPLGLPESPAGFMPTFNLAALQAASKPCASPSAAAIPLVKSEPPMKRKLSGSSEPVDLFTKKPLMEVVNKPPAVHASSQSPRLSSAKMKALKFIRENGTISKEKPKTIVSLPNELPDAKKPNGITQEFLDLMKEKPLDPKLLSDAEAVEREKRFDRLQVVEEVSEKLIATHEVPVRAIRCLVCKKNFHAMPMQCVLSKHGCKVVTGTKRFFECNSCRNRTHTLDRMPTTECSKCGVWSWRRAGMAADRVCNVAPQLAVRGLEEKFMNSVVKDPNLNLLVPEGGGAVS